MRCSSTVTFSSQRSRRTVLVCCLGLLSALLLPSSAAAGGVDFNWCVSGSDDDRGDDELNCGFPCANDVPFQSLSDALEAIVELDAGLVDHQVCVDNIFPLRESIVIETAGEAFGERLVLVFKDLGKGRANICPDPGSPSDQPLITLLGEPQDDVKPFQFEVLGLVTGGAFCEVARPFLFVRDTQVSVENVRWS
jgi:hypothetical protein